MASEKKRLYISHAQGDQAFADQLRVQLRKYGLEPVNDQTAEGLLLVMSPGSKTDPSVEATWKPMLAAGKPIIPLKLAPLTGGFHPEVDKLNVIDVSNPTESFIYKFRRILDGLKAGGFTVTENLTEGLYQMKAAQSPAPVGNRMRWPLIIGGIAIAALVVALLLSRSGGGTPAEATTAPSVETTAEADATQEMMPTATG
jgi:hypothetical protein